MPPLSTAYSMDVDHPAAGHQVTPAISLIPPRIDDTRPINATPSTSGHANRNTSDHQSQRLPPMSLTDLPSPFALPTPTMTSVRDGILSGGVLPSSSSSAEAGPSTSSSSHTDARAAADPARYAYRQPPSTPDTPMDIHGRQLGVPPSPSARLSPGASSRLASATSPPRQSPFSLSSAAAAAAAAAGGGGAGGSMSAASPWHHLAATSGAPTPAVEGSSSNFNFGLAYGGSSGGITGTGSSSATPMANRMTLNPVSRGHSPQIGGPFEKLNLSGGGGGGGGGSSGSTVAQTPSLASTGMADPFSFTKPHSARGPTSGPSGLGPNAGIKDARNGSNPIPPSSTLSTGTGIKLNFPAAIAAKRNFSHPELSLPGAQSPSSSSSSAAAAAAASAGPSAPSADVVVSPSPISASQVTALLEKADPSDPSTSPLILDLRPPSSFSRGRIPGSLSLPIPSTLLKRRTFTIHKLALMLPERAMRAVTDFTSRKDVIIVDQDSSAAPVGGVLSGLASKLASAAPDWKGKIWFVRLGINACGDMELSQGSGDEEEEEAQTEGESESKPLNLGDVDMDATSEPSEGSPSVSGSKSGGSKGSTASSVAARSSGKSGDGGSLYTTPSSQRMAGGLGKLAFQQASTKGLSHRKLNTFHGALSLQTASGDGALADTEEPASSHQSPSGTSRKTSSTTTSRRQVSDVKQLQPANPFFDNIRQNLELSHGGITERIPLNLPDNVVRRSKELPKFLRELVEKPDEQVAEQIANEFESVERGEQRRLQGIMNWHSKGSRKLAGWKNQAEEDEEDEVMWTANAGSRQAAINRIVALRRKSEHAHESNGKKDAAHAVESPGSEASGEGEEYFPFSITAGIERGSKNRYKNIWPYDFSRVRLNQRCHDDGSDYINANFVQPRGTTRRYIATQGPMDATYRDFWTLVWEQGVQVIVMITKQFEGGAIKCGDYWTEGEYGPFQVQMISCEGGDDVAEKAVSDFNFFSAHDKDTDNPTIKRTFILSNKDHPEAPSHKITQMQCVSWPDFDVPSSPSTLLALVKDVDAAVAASAEEAEIREGQPPVLVHCSAGVGRTGSFIVVDAVLDALRREFLMKHRKVRPPHRSSDQSNRPHKDSMPSGASAPEGHVGGASSSRSPGAQTYLSPPGQLQPPIASPDEMELDVSTADQASKEGRFHDNREYGQYRDKKTSSRSDSGNTSAAPSGFVSPEDEAPEEKITDSDNFVFEMGKMTRITDSGGRPRTPTPITDMPEPVKNVLEGIRIQRMSLCQSLRQYAFVYRSVIYGYLNMLDEETQAAEEAQAAHDDLHALHGNFNSTSLTDEEAHIKRRASPTELRGADLTKRPSFRKAARKSDPRPVTAITGEQQQEQERMDA